MLIDPGCLQEDAHSIVVCALRFLVHIKIACSPSDRPDGFVAVVS